MLEPVKAGLPAMGQEQALEASTSRHKKTGHEGRFFYALGNYNLPAFSLR